MQNLKERQNSYGFMAQLIKHSTKYDQMAPENNHKPAEKPADELDETETEKDETPWWIEKEPMLVKIVDESSQELPLD